jgi:hypothetical protein
VKKMALIEGEEDTGVWWMALGLEMFFGIA